MANLNGIRVTRRGDTIFIPLPPELWRQTGFNTRRPCQCGECDGNGYWDTLAVSAKPTERDFTWMPHVPEIQEARTVDRVPVRFRVGQRFVTRHKNPRTCTITDILRTYNSKGDLVKVRYVAEHVGPNGQTVTDHDVPDTTVAMGLIAE